MSEELNENSAKKYLDENSSDESCEEAEAQEIIYEYISSITYISGFIIGLSDIHKPSVEEILKDMGYKEKRKL